MNNPIIYKDEDGRSVDLPNWAKWLIGGIAFVGAIALTYLTGGAMAPVFLGMGISILTGGILQGTISAINNGDFLGGFKDGMSDGAMWGGIFALAGAGLRLIKLLRHGVAIGENMNRVEMLALRDGHLTYQGMPGFKITSKFIGKETAEKLALVHNQHFIERMMRWGVRVFDYGIDAARCSGRSIFYAMERNLLCNYELIEIMLTWGGYR